jgi:hypothetical protein
MVGKNTGVCGIYPSPERAGHAVDAIIAAGFESSDITVLLPDSRSTKDFARKKNTKALEEAEAVATAHAIISRLLGVLDGNGSLAGKGIPKSDARKYEAHVKEGSAFVSVHCNDPDEGIASKGTFESNGRQGYRLDRCVITFRRHDTASLEQSAFGC